MADAITGTLLADLTCNATFAAAASNGVLTLNAITSDSSADATGTATHFRIYKSDGTTAVLQGDVGTSGARRVATSGSVRVTYMNHAHRTRALRQAKYHIIHAYETSRQKPDYLAIPNT